MSGLLRQAAIDKVSSPDQLDRTLQVVRPLHGLGVATLALVVLGGFVWSVLATAPVAVQGQGILLSSAGVSVVSSPSEGRVQAILAEPGAQVKAGQDLVALLRPASRDALLAKQAELAGAREVLQSRQAAHQRYRAMQGGLLDTKRQALARQLDQLQEQRQVQAQRRRDVQALLDKAFATSSKLNEVEAQLADLDSRIAKVSNDRAELLVQQRGEELQKAQEIQDALLRVQALEREHDNMQRDYERNRTLKAPADGAVAEFSVNPGDLVSPGQTVMRLLPAPGAGGHAHATLHAIVFVPNQSGKKVRPGMPAHVVPSTVQAQKDGFIRATVIGVASIPSSREGIMRRLGNAALVDSILRSGAPFEVELELAGDPATHSGYQWSSGAGPAIGIDAGTMASADMVVERRRVISLALPAFDHVFRWLGVR